MNKARFGSLVPERERFVQKVLGGFRVFLSNSFFDTSRQGPDFAANLLIGHGMSGSLPFGFQSGCMSACL